MSQLLFSRDISSTRTPPCDAAAYRYIYIVKRSNDSELFQSHVIYPKSLVTCLSLFRTDNASRKSGEKFSAKF